MKIPAFKTLHIRTVYGMDNRQIVSRSVQGIVYLTGMETVAKEPELTTILRRLNLTFGSRNEIRFAGFCRMSVTPSLLRFGALLRDHLQMGAFFSIDVCFYWLA